MKNLQIQFTENPFQEISLFQRELKLLELVKIVNQEEEVSEDVRKVIAEHLLYLSEMFSEKLPSISGSPEEVLRKVSRDFNISRVLKQRGIMRLYLFTKSEIEQEEGYPVMAYQLLINPYTDEPFINQKDFIGWFCRDASVSRATVFSNLSALDKMVKGLGMELEHAYHILLSKPSIIRDTLNDVASWVRGGAIESVEPHVARRIVEQTMQDDPEKQEELLSIIKEGNEEDIARAMQEPIKRLLEEVAAHDSVHDARVMINEEILQNPRILYHWDPATDGIIIKLEPVVYDEQGNEVMARPITVTLLPDSLDRLPRAVRRDLVTRLPVRNKEDALEE